MQVNSVLSRNAAIFIILLLFLQLTTGLIVQTARIAAHQLFLKGVQAYLGYTTRNYATLVGDDFIVKYTGKDQAIAPLVLETTQQYYEKLQAQLGFSLSEGSKKLVVIYPDRESLTRSLGSEGDQRAVGVYWAGSIRLLSPQVWLEPSPESDLEELFLRDNPLTHELAHLMIDYRTAGNYTRWLTEGLAQYLEEEITGYTLPRPAGSLSRWWSLEELEGLFDDEDEQLGAYWQSRWMVSFLITEHGMEKINRLLEQLGRGKVLSKAFQDIYGFPVEYLTDHEIIGERELALD